MEDGIFDVKGFGDGLGFGISWSFGVFYGVFWNIVKVRLSWDYYVFCSFSVI